MPILPGFSPLTFTISGSSHNTYVDEVSLDYTIQPFIRQEFTHEKLKSAALVDGTHSIVENNIAGTPHQFIFSFTGDVARPLGPTSLANLNSAYQRFNTTRFSLRGAPTEASSLSALLSLSLVHAKYLNNFEYHITKGNSDIKYSDLVALQPETFSYLTSTVLSMSGDSIGGTQGNLLITQFSIGVAYEVTEASGAKTLMYDWNMTAEVRTIQSQNS